MSPEIEGMIYELNNEIKMLRAELAQLNGAINFKVDKNDIVNQINISQEGIKINADKITIHSEAMVEQAANSPLRI